MQGLAGLLFPVLLMAFALGMEKFEAMAAARPWQFAPTPQTAAPAAAPEPGPTVETLATIGLPSAIDRLDLDRDEESPTGRRGEREGDRRPHRRAS